HRRLAQRRLQHGRVGGGPLQGARHGQAGRRYGHAADLELPQGLSAPLPGAPRTDDLTSGALEVVVRAMRYNLLGQTGLYVSELSLGAMTFGGQGIWKAIGELGSTEVEQLVGTALDAGVNFIDTADVYSEGDSERLLGAALKSLARPRERVVVATKVRGRVGPGVNQVGLSRAHVMAAIDASLARLGLDHVHRSQTHGL